MSRQTTQSVFHSAALSSGLVREEQWDYATRVGLHRQKELGNGEDALTDRLLADLLIEQNILTTYQADQLLAGRVKLNLGPYIITDWIGQGGMGQVFKAVHRIMGRECAVKVLPLARATNEARESFDREIRMQAKLDCPYLVRAYDAGQDGNVHYLVTEYVPGMDLRRLVKSSGRLSMREAAKIIVQAAYGLEYAHEKGLVHRDVKPGNILVQPDGKAKVSDVGLAGFAKDMLNDPRAGKIVGTADYLAPEQIRRPSELNPTSDIYALGCTLYYAVCAKVPFPGGDTTSKLQRHLEETPWHPRKFSPELSEEFVETIAEMMDKDPTRRIQSATEVIHRLEPWIDDVTVVSGLGVDRSPWTAPPPPLSEDERSSQSLLSGANATLSLGEAALYQDTALHLDAAHHQDTGISHSGEPPGSSAPPPPFPASLESAIVDTSRTPPYVSQATNRSMSSGAVVALTLALMIPPILLIGAIIGYMLARTQG